MTKKMITAEAAAPLETDEQLIEAVLEATGNVPARIDGIVVARLAGRSSYGDPLIDFDGNGGGPVAARTMVALEGEPIGRELAVAFERGDVRHPIVLGVMAASLAPQATLSVGADALTTEVRDDEIVLSVDKRVVVRCGKASVTLTPAGKIILRGEYVLSRSGGVNRIVGGSVQIN